MLTFINLGEPQGSPTTAIQAHMLASFGLKFRTTVEYLMECRLAGFIVERDGLWHISEKQKKALKSKMGDTIG
jgi:hypothetical protein